MSTATAPAVCVCGHVTAETIQCPEHFHIYRGGKRLASVGSIVKQSFPIDPKIPKDVLDNAKDRGKVADRLFSAYVLGKLQRIPVGTERQDSCALLLKLVKWYDRQKFKAVEVQVLLGCEDHGGVLDFRFDGVPVDLKCTSNVEDYMRMQVAGYARMLGRDDAAILHCTERYAEPKLIPLHPLDYDDWDIMLKHWRMIQRRNAA